MKLIFSTLVWLAIVAVDCQRSAAEPSVKLPDREHFHLYLLMGQSNMAGRGSIEEQDKVAHPRVLTLTKDNSWAAAVDPLHFDKPAIAGVGLGSSFGRVMADASPDVTIGLIPCAVGGTPLARWQKDGDLYQQAVQRAKAAMKDGALRGILWHQGESDAGNEETARNYGERLAQMVSDLRKELNVGDVPFVAGQLGEFLRRESKDGKPSFWPVVNEQIASLPKLAANTSVVSASGLKHKGDEVHFDSPSLRELGKRYAKAMQELQTGMKKSADVRPLTSEERQAHDAALESLGRSLAGLRERGIAFVTDAEIFHKGLTWALKYDREFSPADLALLQKAISRGQERAKHLAAGARPWSTRRGKLALGYVSQVDGSVQPYGLIVPQDYDPTKPCRLDVVLHGSTRPVGLSELRFMARFDDGDGPSESSPDQPFIELHPLGRVENCYRWAGETDVIEAIDDVCRRYSIDKDRIVLRGMSMGASGTWHLGLKHPDRFVALGPYCGYVDTHHFSETPLPNFVKVGPLPEHQELGLHMLDSIDYAANAGVVPAIACMGEKDVFFQAHVLMDEAMRREGLTMVNLISPGTGHVIDPVTHAEQMRRIGEYAARGIDHRPNELRFVTWTLKYNRCHWLEVLGLERHYARAELSGRLRENRLEIDEPRNVTRFAVRTSQLTSIPQSVRVGAQDLAVPHLIAGEPQDLVFARHEGKWQIAGRIADVSPAGKRPGLQGPIDDAFTTAFLCVRGTGTPWNPAAAAYADVALKRFAAEWEHYFRGKLPLKDDTAVTAEDVHTRNLILFGDPGSNSWIAKALPKLPLSWTRESLSFAGQKYSSESHVPALIVPNPLAGGENHYVVLNSGHTFRESELAKLNYLLFPRWGDWAILDVSTGPGGNDSLEEEVLCAGFFDERWQIPP